jgi:hypothetical protein
MKTIAALLVFAITATGFAKDVERTPEQVKAAESYSIEGIDINMSLIRVKAIYPGLKKAKTEGQIEVWESDVAYKSLDGLKVAYMGPKITKLQGIYWRETSSEAESLFSKKKKEFVSKFGEQNNPGTSLCVWSFPKQKMLFAIERGGNLIRVSQMPLTD